MAVAKAGRFLKNQSVRGVAKEAGVSHSRVVYANVIIEYAPDLADAVLAGSAPLNDAYRVAQERKAAAESDDAKFALPPLPARRARVPHSSAEGWPSGLL